MEWQIIVALVIAIPVILFPVAFVWFLNVGGVYAAIKKAAAKRAEQKATTEETKAQTVEIES